MSVVDMHIHSSYSDGIYSPAEIIEKITKKRILGFALTDHDTIDGVAPTREILRKMNSDLIFIAGCEFSTYFQPIGEIHILGYFSNSALKKISPYIDKMKIVRRKRVAKILACLKNIGYSIDEEKLLDTKKSIGRAHIARELMSKGYFNSIHSIFEQLLKFGAKCNFSDMLTDTTQVIKAIKSSGGFSSLAHPFFLEDKNNWKYLDLFKQVGLDAIENKHPQIKSGIKNRLKREEGYRYKFTCGSDFHDDRHSANLGKYGLGMQKARILLKYFSD